MIAGHQAKQKYLPQQRYPHARARARKSSHGGTSKENCKATQIYEGDDELFNFNEEVEPMLNVLCSKTLE